ncbi:MAG: GNAT family N-acetyltransferase [Bacteroidota bacterium]
MQTNSIIYQTKTATKNDVQLHLKLCSDSFIPKLDSRVIIEDYATKISQLAITFEAWNKQKLIGLIAAYFNKESHIGFITNVSVLKENMGTGIASLLLEMCIQYASNNKYDEIKLEVNKDNKPAINFYKKYNFAEIETKNVSLIMNLKINKQ